MDTKSTNNTPPMAQPYPGVREVIRKAFARKTLDSDTADIMLQSLSENTIQQYNTAYKCWYSFCNENNISSQEWHIPRPSLSGSTTSSSTSDARSRGGSASSQGSSSNHSTHSVCSGSFLLNAAHLARMHGSDQAQEDYGYHSKMGSCGRKAGFSEAVVAIPEETRDAADTCWNGVKRGSATGPDATSVASSTHFTVVNGFTKHRTSKEPKSCCCNHSHQVTVLVISMTILFSACILAAICFVEMRMRKETGMYKYS